MQTIATRNDAEEIFNQLGDHGITPIVHVSRGGLPLSLRFDFGDATPTAEGIALAVAYVKRFDTDAAFRELLFNALNSVSCVTQDFAERTPVADFKSSWAETRARLRAVMSREPF